MMLRDVSERKKIQERLKKLNECFLGFKADPNQNINSLVALSGELLEASFALYNRFDNGELLPVGKWNVPSDYEILDKTEGQICSATVRQNTDDVLIVRDLMNTAFARTDVNVMHYQLQAFVSAPVKFGNARVGSLCIVYKRGFEPNEEDMKLLGLLSSAIGVEEARRHSESSLHDSEERFRAISASAFDAIVLVDEGGRISYWNPAAQRIFGYSKEEALGKIAFKLVSPKRFQFTVSREFEDFLNVTQAALDGKVLEYAVCRKDASEFPAELSISSLQIRGRSHAVVIIRDITTRKTMEQDLREGEEKYRNISKKLQGLMKSSAAIIHTTDVRKRLNAIAEAVHSQGWGRVVITLRDESLNATELVSAGLTPQEEQYLIAHQAPGSVWQKRLSSMFERYRLGEFYYLPWSDPIVQEQFKHALTSKVKKTETVDWDPDDLLYVPLKLPDGQIVGIMSIDDPKDGKRPTQSHFLR